MAAAPASLAVDSARPVSGACDAARSCGTVESRPDPDELIAAATDAMNHVQAVHFVLGLEDATIEMMPGLAVHRAEGDVVRPDRMQARLHAKALGMSISVNFRAVEGRAIRHQSHRPGSMAGPAQPGDRRRPAGPSGRCDRISPRLSTQNWWTVNPLTELTPGA